MLETVLSHFNFVHLSRKAWEGCVCEFELLYGAQVPAFHIAFYSWKRLNLIVTNLPRRNLYFYWLH